MLGNVATMRGAAVNARTAVLSDERALPRFAVIARAIARAGSLPGIQLADAPTQLAPVRGWRAIPVSAELERLDRIVRQRSLRDLDAHIDGFRRGAELAASAGFKVIQIHGAHGYLLSLLLNPRINARTDRFRFDGEWFERLVSDTRAAACDALIGVRLNAASGIDAREQELHDFYGAAGRAIHAGADIIDLSAGVYTIDRRLIYPNRGEGALPLLVYARELLESEKCLVAVAGNVFGAADVPSALPDRLLINVGRSLIADPDFATKLRDDAGALISRCRRTSRCHYFSRGQPHISCGTNPNI